MFIGGLSWQTTPGRYLVYDFLWKCTLEKSKTNNARQILADCPTKMLSKLYQKQTTPGRFIHQSAAGLEKSKVWESHKGGTKNTNKTKKFVNLYLSCLAISMYRIDMTESLGQNLTLGNIWFEWGDWQIGWNPQNAHFYCVFKLLRQKKNGRFLM